MTQDPEVTPNDTRGPDEVVVISGLSGAGRSTAADALEDIGYFVIDNMPPTLIPRVVDLAAESEPGHVQRVAFGCDVREGAFFSELDDALHKLAERDIAVRMLFCEASDEVLLRRFEESRRPHPAALTGRVLDGIHRERKLLAGLRERADLILDSSYTNVHEFRARVKDYFSGSVDLHPLRVSVLSFGFKHGTPRDADLLFDVRFLPNPHWVEELRELPGTSHEVREFVLARPETSEFLEHLFALVDFLLPHFVAEGKSYLSVAVGCTGGRHRSVVLSDELARHVEELGYRVNVTHRDLA
ncbi:MAG: RNase adapter RapZ [Acidimicrobiia bacterium]|nr:RNase adapter RapZ [Acidimicrobiia bacterium]